MRRGPEAEFRLRAFSCHRCSCWLRNRCSCWLRCWGFCWLCHRCSCWLRCWCFCWLCHRCSGRRRARPLAGSTAGVSAGCATGVLAGCGTGVLAGCVAGVSAGCATGVPGAVGPARPLTVRAASFARRVGSKPGQALRPRRRPPLWWLVVRVDWSGPLHLQPSHASIAGHSTNFACNSPVNLSCIER